jgi:two-component system phosphate regulon sensor histidine kinase PhoR
MPISWLPWVIVVALTLAAAGLLWLWRQDRAARASAELSLGYAERALREMSLASEWYAAQLRAMQEVQVAPVLVLASDRTLVGMNPGARALFGSAAEIGQTLIQATRSAELDDLVAHCLGGGADCDRQVVLGRGQQPYRARAVRIEDREAGDDYGGVVVALQDLSELQRLGRSRRDFIANISHELRTPITSIRLLVDTLRGIAPVDAAGRDDLLEKISVETEALGQLSQELLDLAQIESGQTLVRMVPASVAELIEGVTKRFGPQAERKQQTIEVSVPRDLTALADPDQVTRVIGNLLHNAIKFTPDEGRIWLKAFRQEHDVVVEVGDTGRGIPPHDLNRVFERFFRGDRSRASGGTGLGLAIAKHVVEAHGGRIWVESEGRAGQGAVFRFTLPFG